MNDKRRHSPISSQSVMFASRIRMFDRSKYLRGLSLLQTFDTRDIIRKWTQHLTSTNFLLLAWRPQTYSPCSICLLSLIVQTRSKQRISFGSDAIESGNNRPACSLVGNVRRSSERQIDDDDQPLLLSFLRCHAGAAASAYDYAWIVKASSYSASWARS